MATKSHNVFVTYHKEGFSEVREVSFPEMRSAAAWIAHVKDDPDFEVVAVVDNRFGRHESVFDIWLDGEFVQALGFEEVA